MSTENKTPNIKGPRVTITCRKNGRWHVGNLDDDALRALYLAVTNAAVVANRYSKGAEDLKITDGRARLLKAVRHVVEFKEMKP